MKTLATLTVALTSCCALSAYAACENPTMVTVPDGANSTMDALLAAQTQIKAYLASMEIYLACLNEELESGGDDAPSEFKALMVNRHNSAVTEMETVAAAFNEQVQAFRAAHPDPQ